jgi:hypothetical protein
VPGAARLRGSTAGTARSAKVLPKTPAYPNSPSPGRVQTAPRRRRASRLAPGARPREHPEDARIGEHVGQRNLAVTANTYSHVLSDETEIDYAELLPAASLAVRLENPNSLARPEAPFL